MNPIESYLYDSRQRDLLLYLHEFLLSQDLESKYRFNLPFYYGKTWICYLNVVKMTGRVELAFVRGRELSQTKHLLNFKKRKMVGGFEWQSLSEVNESEVRLVLNEAIEVDSEVPYSWKSSKRK